MPPRAGRRRGAAARRLPDDAVRPPVNAAVTNPTAAWYADPALAEVVLDEVVDAFGTAPELAAGARATSWAPALSRRAVADAVGSVLLCLDPPADPAAWVDDVVSRHVAVVLAAPTPPATVDGSGRWPASWAAEFARHRWRFVDRLRPRLWADERFGPDACEPWLVFVAPGAHPQLGASPALAMLHPGRINDAVRGVHAELELLREQFLERLQPLAHRRELDVARQRLADAAETIDSQRQQLAALEARVAANERRLVQLMEQQLGLGGPLVAPAAAPVGPASLRRRLLDRLTGQPPARLAATPATPTVSPAVVALFDANSYVTEHPDAAEHPLTHYLTKGEALGYRPNPWFDPLFYRERYPDVARAGVSALVHFADYGGAEGRRASAEFDTEWYVATYPEVRRSGLNPLLHYLAVGAALGHRTRAQALPGEEQR